MLRDMRSDRTIAFQGEPGAYVAIQAYVRPTPEIEAALQRLRTKVRDRFRLATTLGYGPRFLHSTGQLHKGDGGRGLFIQITVMTLLICLFLMKGDH